MHRIARPLPEGEEGGLFLGSTEELANFAEREPLRAGISLDFCSRVVAATMELDSLPHEMRMPAGGAGTFRLTNRL